MKKSHPVSSLEKFLAAAKTLGWQDGDITAFLRHFAEKISGERWLNLGPADSALIVRQDGEIELSHRDFEQGDMPTQDEFVLFSLESNLRDDRLLALIKTFQAEARASSGHSTRLQ